MQPSPVSPTGPPPLVTVVGGGLAGSECSWQLARRGIAVRLIEMRPVRETPAHQTNQLAELVCSNSLRSDDANHPAGLLKREMEAFGSLVVSAARTTSVPAGGALAVDRTQFSNQVTRSLEKHPLVTVERREISEIPKGLTVLATGPLTSPKLSEALQSLLGQEYLYFYDSIAPIVEAESLDYSKLFWASRYGKGEGKDYLNSAMDRETYLEFHRNLVKAEVSPLHDFERKLFFEGCLPLEEMALRGVDTLRFGPLKPVGLEPPDGSRPWAVVQLRRENLADSQFNLVGFQSRLKWPEQRRVFSTIPGLESAEFVRLGQVHRNTFINSPKHLDNKYRLRAQPEVHLAGQITGVEGYLESAASGLALGLYLSARLSDKELEPLPTSTALGALARHLTESDPSQFQPANINFGLFAPIRGKMKRDARRSRLAERSREDLAHWASEANIAIETPINHQLPPSALPSS